MPRLKRKGHALRDAMRPVSELSPEELAAELALLVIVTGDPDVWDKFSRKIDLEDELQRRFKGRRNEGPLNKLEIEYWGRLLGEISDDDPEQAEHFRNWVTQEGRRCRPEATH